MGPLPTSSGFRGVDIMTLRGTSCTCWCAAAFAGVMSPRVDLPEPLDVPGLELVKRSTVRTVWRGVLGDVAVHIKLFRAMRLSDRARDAIGGSRGGKEMAHLLEAQRRGLPCAEPLCAGRWAGSFGARSFLVTRSIAGATQLGPRCWTDAVAHAAGALLRRAHDAGLSAPDLHPGNLVVDPAGALHLLDLTTATWSESLDNRERAQALAFFCLDLDGGVRDPRAAALLDGYAAPAQVRERAERIGRKLRNHALAAFGRRATRPCRHTSVDTSGDGVAWFLCTGAADLHENARALLPELLPEPTKSGRRGAVWLDGPLVVKRRPAAAARRLFAAAYWLEFAGVGHAQPVALRIHHGVGHCYSRRIDAPNLRAEIGSLDATERRRSASSLGRGVGRLHGSGLRNRDLKFDNLVRDPATGEVLMVDLDGVRRKAPLDRRGQAADLGRVFAAWFDAVGADHDRVVATFWRAYLRARRALGSTPNPDLRRRAAVRAREWAERHPTP